VLEEWPFSMRRPMKLSTNTNLIIAKRKELHEQLEKKKRCIRGVRKKSSVEEERSMKHQPLTRVSIIHDFLYVRTKIHNPHHSNWPLDGVSRFRNTAFKLKNKSITSMRYECGQSPFR